jgi:hypothetical protein
MPAKPAAMPHQLTGFHFVTQTVDPRDGTLALLTLASAPPDERGQPVVLYDLNVQRAGDPLCGFDEAGWKPVVEALHDTLSGFAQAEHLALLKAEVEGGCKRIHPHEVLGACAVTDLPAKFAPTFDVAAKILTKLDGED